MENYKIRSDYKEHKIRKKNGRNKTHPIFSWISSGLDIWWQLVVIEPVTCPETVKSRTKPHHCWKYCVTFMNASQSCVEKYHGVCVCIKFSTFFRLTLLCLCSYDQILHFYLFVCMCYHFATSHIKGSSVNR